MSLGKVRFGLTILLWLWVFPYPGVAQQHPNLARGFGVAQSFQMPSNLEAINQFNGGLILRIPIGQQYPLGGDLTYGLQLVYSSKLWDYEETLVNGEWKDRTLPGRTFNAGLGWTLSLGRLLAPESPGNSEDKWVYVAPDGSTRTFVDRQRVSSALVPGYFYSFGGDPLRLIVTSTARSIEFPDGQVHRFDTLGRPTRIEDRSGNYLSISYTASSWVLADQHGRSHVVNFGWAPFYGSQGVVSSVVLEGFEGAAATYTFSYDTVTMHAGCPNNTSPTTYTLRVLAEIRLPDGSSYRMPSAS